MIALFGTTQTSANAVANNLDTIGIIIGQAMGLAMITVVGQCMGAGEPEPGGAADPKTDVLGICGPGAQQFAGHSLSAIPHWVLPLSVSRNRPR